MQKFLLYLFISLFTLTGFAQSILFEGFDNLGSPITLPTGWTSSNLSSPIGTASWFRGNPNSFTAYEGPENGYIGVNYQSGSGTATLSNWLFAPAVNVQNGDVVSFYTRVPQGSSWPDRLELRMSTLGESSTAPSGTTGVGSYTTTCLSVNPSLTAGGYPEVWTKFTYVVTGLTGQVSCKFALRYYVTNGGPNGSNSNYIGVDSFSIRTPLQNDVELSSVDVPAIISAGNYTFNGTVTNSGSNAITSYQITWQANGGAINNMDVTGLNIASGDTHNFSHTIPLNAIAGTTYNLVFNIPTVNGVTDADTSNNTINKTTLVVNEIFPQTVVYEEGTGTWCGFCVRGLVGLNTMAHNHTDGSWIGIAVHNGDPMVVTSYDDGLGISSFPSGYINRKNEVDPGLGELEPAYVDEKNNSIPLGKIDIVSQTWNATSRELSYTVESKFALDIANANFKLSGIIVEDGVTGTTSGYNQSNYYTNNTYGPLVDWDGTNYATLPNPIPAAQMVYNHVGRALIGDFNGIAGSVPASLTYNTPYSYTFNYTLPATYNAENIKLVAIILDASGQIVNADEVELDTTMGFSDLENNLKFTLSPNPSSDIIKVNTLEEVSIAIYDLTGKLVLSQNNVVDNTIINISNLETGVYFINASNGVSYGNLKFVKE